MGTSLSPVQPQADTMGSGRHLLQGPCHRFPHLRASFKRPEPDFRPRVCGPAPRWWGAPSGESRGAHRLRLPGLLPHPALPCPIQPCPAPPPPPALSPAPCSAPPPAPCPRFPRMLGFMISAPTGKCWVQMRGLSVASLRVSAETRLRPLHLPRRPMCAEPDIQPEELVPPRTWVNAETAPDATQGDLGLTAWCPAVSPAPSRPKSPSPEVLCRLQRGKEGGKS